MKTILLYCILCVQFAPANVFTLTQKDKQTINQAYENEKIKVRLQRFENFLQEAATFNTIKKLNRVNSFVNRILPGYDKIVQNTPDFWSTPKQFLIQGKGDCEDYAITKYFTLKQLHIDPKQLYLAIVKVKTQPTLHMVMLYFENNSSIPLVLDNLSWKVLPIDKRKDLDVQVIFNESDSYILKNHKKYKKVNINWGKSNKWENLLYRIYTNKE